jgi:transcriptional regulator
MISPMARNKLTDQQVKSLRAMRSKGKTLATISTILGVSITTICRILKGERYKHVK